jgi:hypothetical protein
VSDPTGGDRLTPAEERLVRLLALLRVHTDEAQTSLQRAVLHRVRWQLISRHVARAIAEIAGAVADGVALVLGSTPRGKERRR